MSGKCPRCSTPITTPPDARGLVHCTGCGTWLRSVARSPATAPAAPMAPSTPLPVAPPAAPVPPAAVSAPPTPPPPVPEPPARAAVAPSPEPAPPTPPLSVPEPPARAAVAPPPPEPAPAPRVDASAAPAEQLQTLIAEIRDLRRMQAEILQMQAQVLTVLRSWSPATAPGAHAAPAPAAGARAAGGGRRLDQSDEDEQRAPDAVEAPAVPPVRRRRKTVLVIDDDPVTRHAAVTALELAQVPVRGFEGAQAAVAAIASDKPDVIVLELDLGGSMPGRDFINMLKATMEWIDIPLVLHTRLAIDGSKEARIQYGADDFVLKGPDSAQALVNHVIALFQRK